MTDIQTLNDTFRKTFLSGQVMLTCGIRSKSTEEISKILIQVKEFNNFTPKNDPYEEHDFGSFNFEGDKIFWKIDYYDKEMKFHSPNTANPLETCRVMTIMLADEY